MKKQVKAHMISHTHWDREWYLTYEQFRVKLVDLVDNLLEILDNDPDYYAFMMDGQTVILEDYLEVKPYNEGKIKDYMKKGRILIGPWYILPDELLISGEAHIRNYIIGDELCREFGSKMPVGYLPDSFGHPSQMPQILRGLGLNTIVFWRGASHEMNKAEFYWKSVDGSKVIAINMPFGYGNSARLSKDMQKTLPRVEKMCKDLADYSNTDIILLMNGSDHILPQGDLTEVIESLNKHLENVSIRHSTLPEYLDELLPKLKDLKTFDGELRHSDKALLLGGTLSTRMYLKQRNHYVEKMTERYIEPFCSIDWIKGGKYPVDLIKHVWKYILKNHPHDSICGCSIDEVHREMMARFNKTEQLEMELFHRSIKSIADNIDRKDKVFDAVITVFNPSQETRRDYIEFTVDFDRTLIREVNFDRSIIEEYEDSIVHPELPEGIEICDANGNKIPAALLSKSKSYELKKSDHTLPEVYKVNRCKVGALIDNVLPIGYSSFYVKKSSQNPKVEITSMKENNFIENEYFRVFLNNSDGTVNIEDKETGQVYTRCNRFEDGGDAGDEYTYSYPSNDSIYTLKEGNFTASIKDVEGIGSSIVIDGILKLPKSLTEDRKARSNTMVDCPLKTTIKIYNGIKRIDIDTEFNNCAKDHRLRVVFPTAVRSEYSYALGHFSVDRRNVDAKKVENWEEMPQSTHPHKGFVDVNDGKAGLAVMAKGLPEFEVINDERESNIALTLLRCVGWLSRPDLITRKGNGGWTLETPEAQCLGKHRFEYSILPHREDWQKAKIYITADHFIHPLYPVQTYGVSGDLKEEYSLIKKMPDEWRLSSIKRAEDGNGIIVRFYSIASEDTEGEIVFGEYIKSAMEVSLNEKDICECKAHKTTIKQRLKKGEIKTLKLVL